VSAFAHELEKRLGVAAGLIETMHDTARHYSSIFDDVVQLEERIDAGSIKQRVKWEMTQREARPRSLIFHNSASMSIVTIPMLLL